MRYRISFYLSATALLLLILFCCVKGEDNMQFDISSPNKRLVDLSSVIYDEQQILEIVNFNGSINEINTKYPIECLREDNGRYRASYLGDGCIAVIFFDNSGNKLLGNIYSPQLLKADFDGLKKGQLIEEVKRMDPRGKYLFLYTGRNDIPKTSSHCTQDGYFITIEYDDFNRIISINEKLI